MRNLTLLVTDACNLKCTYCYQQRSPARMAREVAEQSVDLHLAHDDGELMVSFFGGEPLLELDLIKHVVRYSREQARRRRKRLRFALTTNGMLLDRPAFAFLNRHSFRIKLSFDGIRPEHEFLRGKGTGAKLTQVLDLARSMYNCRVSTHTVVTPQTVDYLAESIEFLYRKGVLEFIIGTEFGVPWSADALRRLDAQYARLFELAQRYYDKWELLPFEIVRPPLRLEQPFKCDVGCNKGIFVAPDGQWYGCTFHIPMWRNHGEYPADFNMAFGPVEKLHQLGVKSDGFRAAVARVNATPYQARLTERHTDLMNCSECPIKHTCHACFVQGFSFGRGPLYVPEHVCHMNLMQLKYAEKMAAYIEKRPMRRLPEVAAMQALMAERSAARGQVSPPAPPARLVPLTSAKVNKGL